MKLSDLANYPFLGETSDYLKENGPDLDDMLHDIAYERVRIQGKDRVLEAVEDGIIKPRGYTKDTEHFVEILSYVMARILVSCVNDPYLIKRYALAEAKTMASRLQEEELQFVVNVADQLGMDVKTEDGLCRIHFIDYLKNTSQMRSKPWRFANQDVVAGYVNVDKGRLARIAQEAFQRRIEEELPAAVNDELIRDLNRHINEIKSVVEERKSTFKAEDFGKIRVTKLPPCMRHFLAKVQAGENLPHSGRFALTAFLHHIGMSPEEILKLFSSSPDFDESKTRYQIEHITGKISGTDYTPPECSTMKSYGICFGEDGLCRKEWMTHPLKYYRTKDKGSRRKESGEEDEGEK